MRIAQVAPLFEAVPPKGYGGTERVVSWLTEALVESGHQVTLFASSDSTTNARLMPASTRALRLEQKSCDHLAYHYVQLQQVIKHANEFDIVHGHLDYLSFPSFGGQQLPAVHTLHGRLDLPYLTPIFEAFNDVPLVSISHSQRKPLPLANWQATVHHGLPADLYTLIEKPKGDYVLFLGRICPEKRLDRAIEIAHRAGIKLKIAAKVDPADKEYFHREIEPLLDTEGVEFINEVADPEKNGLIGNAMAMLFPIDWPEPFGLVMIEAMACGTPVIAFPCGSVPEIVNHGLNGYICRNIEEAVSTLTQIDKFDRKACRAVFERRFTAKRMADDYVRVYESLISPATNNRLYFFPDGAAKLSPVLPLKNT